MLVSGVGVGAFSTYEIFMALGRSDALIRPGNACVMVTIEGPLDPG